MLFSRNVIDVAAIETQGIEQNEYHDRARLYRYNFFSIFAKICFSVFRTLNKEVLGRASLYKGVFMVPEFFNHILGNNSHL